VAGFATVVIVVSRALTADLLCGFVLVGALLRVLGARVGQWIGRWLAGG